MLVEMMSFVKLHMGDYATGVSLVSRYNKELEDNSLNAPVQPIYLHWTTYLSG